MLYRSLVLVALMIPANLSASQPTLLVLGDSLSAGYGIDIEQGWVALLQARLNGSDYDYRIVNASVSGDTTRTGLTRLRHLLRHDCPLVAIVELGANDGLRGISIAEIEHNLDTIVADLMTCTSKVLLLPMQLPPNYGPVYGAGLTEMYHNLAARYPITLGPFILEDIALDPELMQADGLHPTATAQPVIRDKVWTVLEPLLR